MMNCFRCAKPIESANDTNADYVIADDCKVIEDNKRRQLSALIAISPRTLLSGECIKMNWKAWLKFNPYKKLWSLMGKRPWTYIRRDFYHAVPILNLGGFFFAGFFAGKYFEHIWAWTSSSMWNLLIVIIVCWIIGGLQCHFFWGTKYIPDQRGD